MYYILVCSSADVPDAPINLEISEQQGPRNICLSWAPGVDHNSAITGLIIQKREKFIKKKHRILSSGYCQCFLSVYCFSL